MLPFPPPESFAHLIAAAVSEDVGSGDVTSELMTPESLVGVGTLVQKGVGVVCGLPIVEHVCRAFDPRLAVELIPGFHWDLIEGRFSEQKDTPLLRIRGPMRSVLAAERTLLNFVQRMSGIATLTQRYVRRVEGTPAKIYDTRKTVPGHRPLDKYAVRIGGALNHRTGLYDMVLVKDNHLALLPRGEWASALQALVHRSRQQRPDLAIEVEVADLDRYRAVLAMDGIDIILLDNLDCPTMARAVELRAATGKARQVLLEASGGVTLETVRNIAQTGVERISVGALTHSPAALDISLEIEPE